MARDFPFYNQLDETDCGAACIRMIARYYERYYSLEYLRDLTFVDRQGVSLLGISDAAEAIGFHTLGVRISYERLLGDIPVPAIAFWRQSHFIVVYKANKKNVWVGDPAATEIHKITREEFLSGWINDRQQGEDVGVLLLMETTPEFYLEEGQKINRSGWSYVFSFYKNYRKLILQLGLGLLLGSILQIIFPFIMKAIVDMGILLDNTNIIVIMLIAHLVLFLTQSLIQGSRSWILLHTGTHVNIRMISNYLVKVIDKPLRFFDTRMTGDLLQRVDDHKRIERMLTSSSLQTIFSLFSFFIFSVILFIFDPGIFIVFIAASFIYLFWVIYFLRKRKELDYKRFDEMAVNQSAMIQLIQGISDIKLHNAEKVKRWEWERIQAKIFRLNKQYLNFNQWQQTGANFINETKNIFISFLAAQAVVEGQMTLGMLVAVQYIIGQLNSPLEQVVVFIRSLQDAKISLERMNQIHQSDIKEVPVNKIRIMPQNGDLIFDNVSFQYGGPNSPVVLKNISLQIPKGKTTAIVGTSGSGKTTLLKLLLKFYEPTDGSVKLGEISLINFHDKMWRDKCGAVLQDGFIFTESIAKNIALGDETINIDRLLMAVKVANIQQFIESLPLGYNTKIGAEGIGLSQGQKQRILIARAVYKQPEYFFFDEATNALDTENERIIMRNLSQFFEGKTVITVAHRLSTVKKADQIVVLHKGRLIERGTHTELITLRGTYFNLIKNQLELGE
ncbi:MAG: ATP-binding cassette subfamily B protein [Saprospiraceae bacterium]|jgi:ATP-binding cassette subfamily B protein